MNLFMSLLGWYIEVRRPMRCQEAYLPSDAMIRLTSRIQTYKIHFWWISLPKPLLASKYIQLLALLEAVSFTVLTVACNY